MDFNTAEGSYFLGFVQCDGHLRQQSRNRGSLSIEISQRDVDILDKIEDLLPVICSRKTRERNTNFKSEAKFCILNVFDKGFRDSLNAAGVPYGRKSEIISMPSGVINEDYWRGVLDADGSLGITSKDKPFVSLVTKSEKLATDFVKFIKDLTGFQKKCTRNKRDNIYNICVFNEDAVILTKTLYYEGCFCIERKYSKALEVLNWKRPENLKKLSRKKFWDTYEDTFIQTHSLKESIEHLGRTESSIKNRLWRLKV